MNGKEEKGSRLVFTTDKSSDSYQNNVKPELVKGSEIQSEIFNEVKTINQSRKKTIMEKHVSKQRIRLSDLAIKAEYTKLVDFLTSGKKTRLDISKHMGAKNVKFVDNLMQRAKASSENIIASINGFWQIIPAYQSGKDALVDKMVKNRNALWKNSRKKEIPIGGKLRPTPRPATMGPIPVDKPAHFEFDHGDKKIIIDVNEKGFNLFMTDK